MEEVCLKYVTNLLYRQLANYPHKQNHNFLTTFASRAKTKYIRETDVANGETIEELVSRLLQDIISLSH